MFFINEIKRGNSGKDSQVLTEKLWKSPGETVVFEAKPEYKAGRVVNSSEKHAESKRERTEKSLVLSTRFLSKRWGQRSRYCDRRGQQRAGRVAWLNQKVNSADQNARLKLGESESLPVSVIEVPDGLIKWLRPAEEATSTVF